MTKAAAETYRDASRRQRRDELVLDNLEFVRHVLAKVCINLPANVDVENLEAAGVLGLVEAARHFDPHRGVAFRTYAYPRVRGAIIDELRRNCPLPQQMLNLISRVRKVAETLEPPVTPEQIAGASGLTEEQVMDVLEAVRFTRPTEWDEALFHRRSESTSTGGNAAVELEERKQVLADCIEALPEQERIVVTLYYLEDLRLKEIGAVLELSESRISRILTRAEFRLKQMVKQRGV